MPSSIQTAKYVLAAVKTVAHGRSARGLGEHLHLEYGWTVLGSGQCGVTIVHPTNVDQVIKVFTKTDDGGMDFAVWTMRQQMQGKNSVHLPEILAIHIDGSLATVAMERLQPSGEIHRGRGDTARNDIVRKWQAGFSPNCPVLEEYFTDFGTPDDLHGQNWMLRGDTPVLIDPLFARPWKAHRWEQYWYGGKIQMHAAVTQNPVHPADSIGKVLDHITTEGRRIYRPALLPLNEVGIGHPRPGMQAAADIWYAHRKEVAKHREVHAHRFVHGIKHRDAPIMQPMPAVDFAAMEMRILAWNADQRLSGVLHRQMRQMADAMGVPAGIMNPAGNRIPIQKVMYERAPLVRDGSPAAIRAEKESNMLRIRSEHDTKPRDEGVQCALLPGQQSRRVPSARRVVDEGNRSPKECIGRTTTRPTGPPTGLHIGDTGTSKDLATALIRWPRNSKSIWNWLQPKE